MGSTGNLPVLDGLALAVARLPGPAGAPAGGTWYDVTAGADGRVAIALGDVRAAPADVAGQLCGAAGGALSRDRSAVAVLRELDRVALRIPEAAGSTALCLTLDPAGVLRWATAGHAAPWVVGPDGARALDGADGAPLGRPGGTAFVGAREQLAAGDTLVLAVDGAGAGEPAAVAGGPAAGGPVAVAGGPAAAPGEPAAVAVAVGVVAQHHELAPSALAELLEQAAAPAAGTLLLARLMPAPLQQRLPADPRRLSGVRRAVAAWSEQAALSEDTAADLQLLLSEAATNAVEHAYRPTDQGEFVYSVRRRGDAGIRVVVQDFGRWRPPPADPGYRGRGLAVIHNLAEEVTLEHSDHGTRIAFTLPGDLPPLEERPLRGVTQGWTPADGPSR